MAVEREVTQAVTPGSRNGEEPVKDRRSGQQGAGETRGRCAEAERLGGVQRGECEHVCGPAPESTVES